MQNSQPLVAHTYVSRTDPSLIVFVVKVNVFEAGDESDTPFTVECCDPAFKDDIWNADGLEMTAEVWAKHEFELAPK